MKTLIIYSKKYTSYSELGFLKSLNANEYFFLCLDDEEDYIKYFNKIGLNKFIVYLEIYFSKLLKLFKPKEIFLENIIENDMSCNDIFYVVNFNCKKKLDEFLKKHNLPLIHLKSNNSLSRLINRKPYLDGELILTSSDENSSLYKFQIPNSISLLINDKILNLTALQIFIKIKKNLKNIKFEEVKLTNDKILNFNHNIIYLIRLFSFFGTYKKKSKGYSVYYKPIKSTREIKLTPTKKKNYFADPFIIEHENFSIIFHEEFDFILNRGVISATSIEGDKNKYLGVILKEDFHLSFPYIFEDNGKLYMIPESNKSNSIRLYECVSFPMKWEFKKTLINNIDSADNILIKKNSTYYILANEKFGNYHGGLSVYFSKDLLSDNWTSHSKNPIEVKYVSRNGGIIKFQDNYIIPKQVYNYLSYGDSLNFYDLQELSIENVIFKVNYNFNSKQLINSHHFNRSNNYIVYDKKNI